jgi:hypothetical protein
MNVNFFVERRNIFYLKSTLHQNNSNPYFVILFKMKSKVDEDFQKKKSFTNLTQSGQSSKLGLVKVCVDLGCFIFFF